jgi:hypothetical protein
MFINEAERLGLLNVRVQHSTEPAPGRRPTPRKGQHLFCTDSSGGPRRRRPLRPVTAQTRTSAHAND